MLVAMPDALPADVPADLSAGLSAGLSADLTDDLSAAAGTRLRSATAADAPAVRTVLALAFRDNPMIRWALPDDGTRLEACAAWLGPSVDRYLALGRVHVAEREGRLVGAAAWRLHGVDVASHAVAASLPTPAGALALLVGPARAGEVLAALGGATTASAPAAPADYLNYLVVAPDEQGRGIGRALVLAGIRESDAQGRDTWLCTTDPRNHPFYARLGYVPLGQHELAPGGPGIVALGRRQSPSASSSAPSSGAGSANQTTVSP
jgi:GNAT superfamily N-acetyltransferase